MTRILHLSDLHFGLSAALVQLLLDLVNAARADLVVVTGDLTHWHTRRNSPPPPPSCAGSRR